MKKGQLIVIEGACDGVGKSTQLNLLALELSKNEEVITNHFPDYNSPSSKLVCEYLKGNLGAVNDISPYAIHAYYALDREYVWRNKLQKEYEEGKKIIVDRYTTSSMIYQTALSPSVHNKVEFMKFISKYEYDLLKIQRPDLVIFLDADFNVVKRLLHDRESNDGIINDIHESNIELMKKFYESAKFVADYYHWPKVNCTSDDMMRSKEEIHDDVLKLVKKI